jgi:hypothetical protein
VNAWAVLLAASGEPMPAQLDRVTRWRLRQSLEHRGLEALLGRLQRRADVHRRCAEGSALHALSCDQHLVFTGVSAAARAGGGLARASSLDAYIPSGAFERLADEHSLSRAPAARANVTLRVVPQAAWQLPARRFAPRAAVALDLLSHADATASAAGAQLLSRLMLRRWESLWCERGGR